MDSSEEKLLNQMHVTGKDIACVFADVIPSEIATELTGKLLILLREISTNDGYASRMMILGALAALGQEAQEDGDFDACRKI